jgi:hypothetical protein
VKIPTGGIAREARAGTTERARPGEIPGPTVKVRMGEGGWKARTHAGLVAVPPTPRKREGR